jgi:formamidopyrimidine-DNA glycosylase
MPELPEVETVARGLARHLPGEKIKAVKILRPASIAFPDTGEFASSLIGHSFQNVHRRGKYILIDLDQKAGLVCHLRMSGRLLLRRKGQGVSDERFLRVQIKLASGNELHFEDMRVFGRLWYKPSMMTLEEVVPSLAELSVEPLEALTWELLRQALEGKSMAIKTALLDQTIIAGVGNIYADEALFLSSIHPQHPAGSLKPAQLKPLVQAVRKVLEDGIENGGSTLRDYVNADGVNGNYQNEAWVYGREDEPCRRCGNEIVRIKLGGRSAHFCPRCQKKFKAK